MTIHSSRLRARRLALHALAFVLALAACNGRDAGDADDADPGESAQPGVREGVIELSITETAGTESYTFGRVSGIVADARGRIYVGDSESDDVRVFAPDGKLLYRIGRKGQGPGEFEEPCCLALRDGDRTLWVRDGGNGRYQAFTLTDTGATYRQAVRLAHTDVNRWAPLGFDPAGNLIDIGSLPRKDGPLGGTPDIGRYHIGITKQTCPEGAGGKAASRSECLESSQSIVSVDTVTRAPKDSVPIQLVPRTMGTSRVIMYVYQPYGPSELLAHSPTGEWARGISSRYSIALYGPDNKLVRTLERSLQGPALSARERQLAEDDIAQDMKRTGLPRGQMPFDIPSRKQPLRSLAFDQEGRLWVHHSVPDGENPRADVYEPDGRMLFQATWPRGVQLDVGARGDIVYGIQRDSLDTPSVVRLKLRPVAGQIR